MKIDDIRSPGLVPNTHRLRQEVIRAISFAQNLQSSEKATDLTLFFRDAIAFIDREIGSGELPEGEKTHVDESAKSPFDDDELPTADKGFVVPFGTVEPTPKVEEEPKPEPKPEPEKKPAPKTTAKKGK